MNGYFVFLTSSLLIFYAFHMAFSLIVSIVASYFLRNKFETKSHFIILFFLVLNLSLPLVGYFITAWIVYYLLTVRYEKQLQNIKFIDMVEFENEFPEIQRVFGESAIDKLLNSEDDLSQASLKMRALVSLADNAGKNDIMRIKERLSDKNDEIRLYSFSIIDKFQRGINGQIHAKMAEFNQAQEGVPKAKAAQELAYLYWDLIYYELTDSDLKSYIMSEVQKYALIALEYNPNNEKINVLLGKAYLDNSELDLAQEHFARAIEHGVNMDFIVPYLAEIYYLKKDYAKVKELLASTKGLKENEILYPLVVQWE